MIIIKGPKKEDLSHKFQVYFLKLFEPGAPLNRWNLCEFARRRIES